MFPEISNPPYYLLLAFLFKSASSNDRNFIITNHINIFTPGIPLAK